MGPGCWRHLPRPYCPVWGQDQQLQPELGDGRARGEADAGRGPGGGAGGGHAPQDRLQVYRSIINYLKNHNSLNAGQRMKTAVIGSWRGFFTMYQSYDYFLSTIT